MRNNFIKKNYSILLPGVVRGVQQVRRIKTHKSLGGPSKQRRRIKFGYFYVFAQKYVYRNMHAVAEICIFLSFLKFCRLIIC